jgi:hypothetical protein
MLRVAKNFGITRELHEGREREEKANQRAIELMY